MPAPQSPVLLYDNVFNRVRQYPAAVLSASSTATGSDVRVLSSGRRERAYWEAVSSVASNYVAADLGIGAAKIVDSLWIDRGHNVWGKTIQITGDDGAGGGAQSVVLTTPAQGAVGGDPTSNVMCATEEGALYALLLTATFAAHRRWIVYVSDVYQPLLTGVILGQRVQLPIFSTVMDEDAGKLAGLQTEQSDAGLLATSRVYDYRTLALQYAAIGSTTYDTTVRAMRELLFARKQLCFIAPNYGTYPARGWLYRHDGDTWSAPTQGVLRRLAIPFREVGAQIK